VASEVTEKKGTRNSACPIFSGRVWGATKPGAGGAEASGELGAGEELPVDLGGTKIQSEVEVTRGLRLAIDDFGADVESAGEGGDADLFIFGPGEPGFHPRAAGTDVCGDRPLQDAAKISGEEADGNFRWEALFESSFHLITYGPWHKFLQLNY
jgi:hypothetical protein